MSVAVVSVRCGQPLKGHERRRVPTSAGQRAEQQYEVAEQLAPSTAESLNCRIPPEPGTPPRHTWFLPTATGLYKSRAEDAGPHLHQHHALVANLAGGSWGRAARYTTHHSNFARVGARTWSFFSESNAQRGKTRGQGKEAFWGGQRRANPEGRILLDRVRSPRPSVEAGGAPPSLRVSELNKRIHAAPVVRAGYGEASCHTGGAAAGARRPQESSFPSSVPEPEPPCCGAGKASAWAFFVATFLRFSRRRRCEISATSKAICSKGWSFSSSRP